MRSDENKEGGFVVESAVHSAAETGPALRSEPREIQLPRLLDLTDAQGLRDNLASLLNGGGVSIDASAVERISTPCVQVLLAGALAAEASHAPFQIMNASTALRAAVSDLGLQTHFQSWME